MTTQEGFKWMGVMSIAVTALLATIHFPMWGSMFFPPNPDATEEDYYISVGMSHGFFRKSIKAWWAPLPFSPSLCLSGRLRNVLAVGVISSAAFPPLGCPN